MKIGRRGDPVWLDQVGFNLKRGQGSLMLQSKYTGDTTDSIELYGRPRVFYDRQFSGNRSAACGREVQKKLRCGQPSTWDLSALLWLLLNSGHDHKAGSSPSEVSKGLLGAVASSSSTSADAMRAVKDVQALLQCLSR